MPSDVPSTFDSMSWVAKPLPAKSTSIHPPATSCATAGAPPVCTTAGPHTASTRPPAVLGGAQRGRPPAATSSAFGFSDDTSEFMNSKWRMSRSWRGGCTRTPSWPTTTRSPARMRCIGHGADAWPVERRRSRSPSPGSRRRATGRRCGRRCRGWSSSGSRRAGRRRRRRSTSSASWWVTRLTPCTASRSHSTSRAPSSSRVMAMRARLGSRFVRPISTSSRR